MKTFRAGNSKKILVRSFSNSDLNNVSGETPASLHLTIGGATVHGSSPNGDIAIVYFDNRISQPYDAASGALVGRRQHTPFTIRKEIDIASPLLYQAFVSGKRANGVLTVNSVGDQGIASVMQITFTNMTIVSSEQMLPDTVVSTVGGSTNPLEEIQFTYQKITWTGGGITASDSWSQ
jgi:type VI secretion system secreted protein Hcp